MVGVKICGITNPADAMCAIASGADALGFNFYHGSPRCVSVSRAREIIRHLPRRVAAVGIFVNAPESEVLRIARGVNLNFLQLHGDERPGMIQRLAQHYPVIRAFRVGPKFRVNQLGKYKWAAAFLLDGFDPVKKGGTGKAFDWRVVRAAKRFGPVIVAGGLRPENVADAIRLAVPAAIDVCSGVEVRPGKKGPKKVKQLMRAVERTRRKMR